MVIMMKGKKKNNEKMNKMQEDLSAHTVKSGLLSMNLWGHLIVIIAICVYGQST